MIVFCAAEDSLSYVVVEKMIRDEKPGVDTKRLDARIGGSGALRRNLSKYIDLSKRKRVVVVTDLDDALCAPQIINDWFGGAACPNGLTFRVAVREIESWILADRSGIAEWMQIPLARVPVAVDDEPDPKKSMIDLARRAKNSDVRRHLPPNPGARVGTGYNALLAGFVNENWDVTRAKINSPSLEKAHRRIADIRP